MAPVQRSSRHRLGRAFIVLTLLVAPALPVDADSAPRLDAPTRFVVGFESLPRELRQAQAFEGARILKLNEPLRYALVETTDASFEPRALLDERVRYVEPQRLVKLIEAIPNDPLWAQQYGPPLVQAPPVWDSWRGDSSRSVCIVDTGVRYTHEDLAGARWLGGYDFVNLDANADDDHGHGTHVAGTAAGSIGNGKGIAGIANIGILAAKVLNSGGSGYYEWVAAGIQWCADNGGDIISMSLGGGASSSVLADAVTYASNKGSLLVAAAGNSGCSNCVGWPARYPATMAVACVDATRALCSFSSRGPEVDIAAPGYQVLSTGGIGGSCLTNTGYCSHSGTSMSTPHVSGVAGLLWSAYPELTTAQVRAALEASAFDLGGAGLDESFGWGLVDARRAFELIQPPPPPTIPILERSFDSGVAEGFTLGGLWRVDSLCTPAPPSSPGYLGYHSAGACSYATGARTNGSATIAVDLSTAISAALELTAIAETESSPTPKDVRTIEASRDAGATWSTLKRWDSTTPNPNAWTQEAVALDAVIGGPVLLRFSFDSVDALANAYSGWRIDDLRVLIADNYPPIARAGVDQSLGDADDDGTVLVDLDGSGSGDRDGTVVSASWSSGGTVVATTLATSLLLPVGEHVFTLQVTDDDGALATDTVNVTVLPNRAPSPSAVVDCDGRVCEFDASASYDPEGTIVSYTWELGDSATASGRSVSHEYPVFGAYVVNLTVVDDAGFGATLQLVTNVVPTIHIREDFDDGLAEGFSFTGFWHVGSSCPPAASGSSYLGYHRVDACSYDTGNAANSGRAVLLLDLEGNDDMRLKLKHRYETEYTSDPGGYDVRTIEASADGVSWTQLARWTNQDPSVNEWTSLEVDLDEFAVETAFIRFTFDTVDEIANNYEGWYIDDLDIVLRPGTIPVARAGPDLVVSDTNGDGLQPVPLDGSASRDDGEALSYEWREGETVLGTGVTFAAPLSIGSHVVTLVATDENGYTDTDTLNVTVIPNVGPTARAPGDLVIDDIDATGSEPVPLVDEASTDPDGFLARHDWYIGGNLVATGASTTADLPIGTYTVTLVVADDGGLTSSDTFFVRVDPNDPPKALATVTCDDRVCRFDGRASSDPDQPDPAYAWTLGDGTTGSDPFLVHVYSTVGAYDWTLTVRDASGATSLASGIAHASSEPTRTAPGDAPQDPHIRDMETSQGDAIAPLDVTSAWFEADVHNLYIGMRVTALPPTPLGNYTVEFRPTWPVRDPRWGGAINLGVTVDRLRVVAKADDVPSPVRPYAFELQGVVRGVPVRLATLEGTAETETNILWWVVPRTLIQDPSEGSRLDRAGASTSYDGRGLRAPAGQADSTGTTGSFEIRYAPRG